MLGTRNPQSCWERHRTQAQLSSLSFSSQAWRQAESESHSQQPPSHVSAAGWLCSELWKNKPCPDPAENSFSFPLGALIPTAESSGAILKYTACSSHHLSGLTMMHRLLLKESSWISALVLGNSALAHESLEMQLIKTAALHVDERKDGMAMLALHFLLHALPNLCPSGS